MKRFLTLVLMLAAVPLLSFAQNVTLTSGFDGSPEILFPNLTAGCELFDRITPAYSTFTVDSVRLYLYRANTSVAPTVNFKVNFYSLNGVDSGSCGCTTAPGTLLGSFPMTYTFTSAPSAVYLKLNINPNLAINGAFMMGYELVSISGGGTGYPSILADEEDNIDCCNQYFQSSTTGGYYDNNSGTASGAYYMAAIGVNSGTALPGRLTVKYPGLQSVSVDSTVADTLVFGNDGGVNLTITSITSNNTAFSTNSIGSGIVVAPGASAKLAFYFHPIVAGDTSCTLSVTDNTPALRVTSVPLTGRGISHTNLFMFDNLFNGNGYGSWVLNRFGAEDETATWDFFYNPQHSSGTSNIWANHGYTASGADNVDDILGTPKLPAPAGNAVSVEFRNNQLFGSDVFEHDLTISRLDTWRLSATLDPTSDNEWMDYPYMYYLTGITDSFRVGFRYTGVFADEWEIDDILLKAVPPAPPYLFAEPRGDAFSTAHEIVCDAFDPNGDNFAVVAHIEAVTATFVDYPMTETPAGSGHFCLNFTDFVTGAGTYNYYITATDITNSIARFPLSGSYQFKVQGQTGATELIYHDGVWNNAHYYNNMGFEDAVRFTPSAYPYLLTGAKIGILNIFPNSFHEQLEVKVYAGDGTDGLPGTVLFDGTKGSIGNYCAGMNDTTNQMYYAEVVFGGNILINSGTFYIAVKNPATAVSGEAESWTLDTLGLGNTYTFDPTTSTWAADNVAFGDAMISALGYTAPATPVLTVRNNLGNTAVSIYVNGVTGTIPPTNLYYSLTPEPDASYTLVSGSPFTTSPISQTYPAGLNIKGFYKAVTISGPTYFDRLVPPTDPINPTCSVATQPSSSIRVAAASPNALNYIPNAVSPKFDVKGLNLISVNPKTGERKLIPMNRSLGAVDNSATITVSPNSRGPVRMKAKSSGFEVGASELIR
jgi:hypothetical protein